MLTPLTIAPLEIPRIQGRRSRLPSFLAKYCYSSRPITMYETVLTSLSVKYMAMSPSSSFEKGLSVGLAMGQTNIILVRPLSFPFYILHRFDS